MSNQYNDLSSYPSASVAHFGSLRKRLPLRIIPHYTLGEKNV